jgi:hypothetical protein
MWKVGFVDEKKNEKWELIGFVGGFDWFCWGI